VVICRLRLIHRFLNHDQVFTRENYVPVVVDDLLDDAVELCFERRARLLQITLRDQNRGAIRKKAPILEQRLRDRQRKRGSDIRVDEVEGIVVRNTAGGEIRAKFGSRLKQLRIFTSVFSDAVFEGCGARELA